MIKFILIVLLMLLFGCQENNNREPFYNANTEDIVIHSQDLNSQQESVEMIDTNIDQITSDIYSVFNDTKIDCEYTQERYVKLYIKENSNQEIFNFEIVKQIPKDMSVNASGFINEGKHTLLINFGIPSPIEGNEEQRALAYSYTFTEQLEMCEGNPLNVFQNDNYCVLSSAGGYDISNESIREIDEFINNNELVIFE